MRTIFRKRKDKDNEKEKSVIKSFLQKLLKFINIHDTILPNNEISERKMTMCIKRAITFVLLVMMIMTAFVPVASAKELTFADKFGLDLYIDMNGNSVTGVAEVTSLNGIDTSTQNLKLILAFYDVTDVLVSAKLSSFDTFKLSEKTGKYTVSDNIPDGAITAKLFAFDSMNTIIPLAKPAFRRVSKSLKVLAIGNSFSVDGMQYLYQIAKNAGYTNVVLGNLFVAGCSLNTHWNYAQNNTANYTYYKNTTGTWTERASSTMLYGIKDEDWDIITMQQVSGSSGVASTYTYLPNIINYVKENKTNPNAKFGWHMTWAYQGDSTHADFANYGKSQTTMYNAIVSAYRTKVLPTGVFDYLIPSGTAVQNTRTSYFGDTLTRDGYHMSIPIGRYITGLMWLEALTGAKPDKITYTPGPEIDDDMIKLFAESVDNAYKKPFEVTNSTYTKKPEINLEEDYTLLNLELTPYAYWFSTNKTELYLGIGDDFNSKFIATQKLTKEDIPVGSLIFVDAGWVYRPEGWQTLNSTNTSERPGNVTVNMVKVTDAWWGNYTVRAFNLSTSPQSDISKKTDEARAHFRIYVPKKK